MIVAIDLGGTNVRAGLVDGNSLLKLLSEPCRADKSESEVAEHIFSLVDRLMTPEVTAIGVGVPSVVDSVNGIVYDVVGIPSWKEVHLKDMIEKRFGVPAYINNDCNCFALGIFRAGEARDYGSAVCVTLGTGVGCGLIIGGRLYNGHNTGAGEIGCIPYLDRDYEYYCSSRFFTGRGTTGKMAAQMAVEGDKEALNLWQEFGRNLGRLVTMIVYAYDPEILVFGGSIAKAHELYEEAMRQEFSASCIYSRSIERLRIEWSEGADIQILGAASLCDA